MKHALISVAERGNEEVAESLVSGALEADAKNCCGRLALMVVSSAGVTFLDELSDLSDIPHVISDDSMIDAMAYRA